MVSTKGFNISVFLRFIIVLLYPIMIALERTTLVGVQFFNLERIYRGYYNYFIIIVRFQ